MLCGSPKLWQGNTRKEDTSVRGWDVSVWRSLWFFQTTAPLSVACLRVTCDSEERRWRYKRFIIFILFSQKTITPQFVSPWFIERNETPREVLNCFGFLQKLSWLGVRGQWGCSAGLRAALCTTAPLPSCSLRSGSSCLLLSQIQANSAMRKLRWAKWVG